MRKFKYILICLLLVASTPVINGGIKSKPCVVATKANEPVEEIELQGFPDLISFTNYINQ